jgi:8-oxo-dGTP diphosphatase
VSRSLALIHSWRAGDLLLVDNHTMLQSRAPFAGMRHMLRFRYDDPHPPSRHDCPVGHAKLPAPVLHVAGKCLRTWWKIRKPATFGVKVLLIHPDDPAWCLIVRHSYSDSARWGLPGGGYRPGRETPEQAGVREVSEELALTVNEVPTVLETVCTTLEGKRDSLTIVQATPVSASFVRSPEIAEARWVRADVAAMPEGEPVSRWLERALSARRR